MTFWEEVRSAVKKQPCSSDVTTSIYKKIATSGVNMLYLIKPSFYIGQLSVLTSDFMSYVEKFLASEDRDWSEYLKFFLYIREISKKLLSNIHSLESPLYQLINSLEEIFEGENTCEDEIEEEEEPEVMEDIDTVELNRFLNEDDDAVEDTPREKSLLDISFSREEMAEDYERIKKELTAKIKPALGERSQVIEDFATELACVYQECIQLRKEILRLSDVPDGDIAMMMSILVDIQYGLCDQMKRHIQEDIMVEDRFRFDPGLLSRSAQFLAEFSDKINNEV